MNSELKNDIEDIQKSFPIDAIEKSEILESHKIDKNDMIRNLMSSIREVKVIFMNKAMKEFISNQKNEFEMNELIESLIVDICCQTIG